MNYVSRIDDLVRINHMLVSVSDKGRLDRLIPQILQINPEIRVYSTGGTYKAIAQIIGAEAATNLTQVADYTGQPEMQGGLVKTLDFKIYLGLLSETYNPHHSQDLDRVGAVPIDLVVVNLYPFEQTIENPGATPEKARANIDIGGPCMIRASAKNFHRVAVLTDPNDYAGFLQDLQDHDGCSSLEARYRLAQKAFGHTAAYDAAIASYLGNCPFKEVRGNYTVSG